MSQQTTAATSAPRHTFTPPPEVLEKMQDSPATSLNEMFTSGEPFPKHVNISCDAELSSCFMCTKGPNGPFAIMVIGDGIHYVRLTVSGVHNLPKGWYSFAFSGNAKLSAPEHKSPYVDHEISVKGHFTANAIQAPAHRVWPSASLENWFICKRQGKELFEFEVQVERITNTHISLHDISFSGVTPKVWAITTVPKTSNPLLTPASWWKIRAVPSWQVDPLKEKQDIDVTMTEVEWLQCLDSPQDIKRQRDVQASLTDNPIPNKRSTHESASTVVKTSSTAPKAPLPSQK